MTHTYFLAPTLTHDHRRYTFCELNTPVADGFVTIQQGLRGPRGGKSKLDVASYFVQLVSDPATQSVGRVYLLRKHQSEDVYEVFVPLANHYPSCTCDGYRSHKHCKHADTLEHLFRVVGWGWRPESDNEPADPLVTADES